MAPLSDFQIAYFNKLIYYEKDPDGPVQGFRYFKTEKEGAMGAYLFVSDVSTGQTEGTAVLAFLGTDSSKGPQMAMNQMATNWELTKDPEDDMKILSQANQFARSVMEELEQKHSTVTWHWVTTGHSLGGLLATAVIVENDPKIDRCVTFDSPGLIKHYRDKAFQSHNAAYWQERIRDYVTFPNPINTTLPKIGDVVRLELDIHNSFSVAHAVRCMMGTSLRVMVYASLVNLGLSGLGKTRGFWAAKVVGASLRGARAVAANRLNLKRLLPEVKAAIFEEDAYNDAEEAPRTKGEQDKGTGPHIPLVWRLPARVKALGVTVGWAASTIAASSVGYLSTRTGGNLKDTSQEHMIDNIITGFNEETGSPNKPVPMKTWPYHELLIKNAFTSKHSKRLLAEGFLPWRPAAYGVHNILNRKKLLVVRAQSLPGYVEKNA